MKYRYKVFWRNLSKLIALFSALTFLIYFILDITIDLITQADKYEKPLGRSVQVLSQEDIPVHSYDRILDHWKRFMEFGE